MHGEPVVAVLMLAHLGFAVWHYGLAFAVPCPSGLIVSRVARRVAARWGERRVLRVVGTLRACWPLGLAFVQPGPAGLVIVMTAQFGLILGASVVNSLCAAHRLTHPDVASTVHGRGSNSGESDVFVDNRTTFTGLLDLGFRRHPGN